MQFGIDIDSFFVTLEKKFGERIVDIGWRVDFSWSFVRKITRSSMMVEKETGTGSELPTLCLSSILKADVKLLIRNR